jgi:serine protease
LEKSAPRGEKIGEERCALGFEHPAGYLGTVVEGGLGEDVEDTAGRAGLGVGGAVDDNRDAGEDDCASAHRTGLERHIESRVREPPPPKRLGGGTNREDLGVGSGVGAQLALVAGGGERLAVAGNDGANRHVALALGLAGARNRQVHQLLVRGSGNLTLHTCGSMCHYNFVGGLVLGDSSSNAGICERRRQMNRCLPTAAATLLTALCLTTGPAWAASGVGAAHGFAPRQLLVKFTNGQATRTVVLPSRIDVREAATALRDSARVEYAVPNYIATASVTGDEPVATIPNDPGPITGTPGPPGGWVTKQWNFLPWEGVATPLLPISPGGIDAAGAWRHLEEVGHPGAEGVTVAVLDTGIAYRARGSRFRRSPDFSSGQFVKGFDFVDNDRLPLDENGHGTHVAGTIAEKTNNGIGLTGLAFRAKLMPVRVLDAHGRGQADRIAKGIRFAVANGANVINMSFNFGCNREVPGVDEALRQAYRRGVIAVASIGNLGSEACVAPPATGPHAIGVGGSTEGGCLGNYSLAGKGVDVIAPGGGFPTAGCPSVSAGPIFQVTLKNGSFRHFGEPSDYIGTSMAAAHVSGLAALVLASGTIDPKAKKKGRVGAVTQRLRETARDLGLPSTRQGAGLIDAARATEPAA